MKKNLWLFFIGLLLLQFSCRPEHEASKEITETNPKTGVKFSIFSKNSITAKGNNEIDFAKGFAFLAQRYDSIHKTNFSGLVNTKNKTVWSDKDQMCFITENIEPYIEFRIHSKTSFLDNSDIWVLFPIIDKGIVNDLALALLTEEETEVNFYKIKRNSDFYLKNVTNFQNYYNRYFTKTGNSSTAKDPCGYERVDENTWDPYCTIDLVEISVPPKSQGQLHEFIMVGPNQPGGPCSNYQNCNPDPTPGSGGSNPTNNQNDPCEKAKTVGKNEKTKKLMSDIKTKTNSTKEIGYVLEDSNGTINEHYIEGKNGEAGIEFSISNGKVDGYIHTHYTGLLSIFSPDDIFAIAQMYKQGVINNINTFTVGVVTASGTQYLMVIDNPTQFHSFAENLFNGTTFDRDMLDAYSIVYNDLFKIKTNQLFSTNEKNFYNYISTSNTGLALLKGSNDMQNWSIISKDSQGNIKTTDCK